MSAFRLYNMLSTVTLLVVMSLVIASWSSFEAESSSTIEQRQCIEFDRWSHRKSERFQFINCVARKIELNDYSLDSVEYKNEWHHKHGFVLVIRHSKKKIPCELSKDVWYLDRNSLKIVGFEGEQVLCQVVTVD